MKNDLIHIGKCLAWLLRHDKESFDNGLIDEHGWRCVKEIIENNKGFTKDIIEEIVKTNEKQRYEFNIDHTKIRARQGHSIPVDVELPETEPPEFLYHGTSEKALEGIYKEGIKPRNRLYVHLSEDQETAEKVGQRHGKVCILKILAKEMWDQGIKFWRARNGVWLVKEVETRWIVK